MPDWLRDGYNHICMTSDRSYDYRRQPALKPCAPIHKIFENDATFYEVCRKLQGLAPSAAPAAAGAAPSSATQAPNEVASPRRRRRPLGLHSLNRRKRSRADFGLCRGRGPARALLGFLTKKLPGASLPAPKLPGASLSRFVI